MNKLVFHNFTWLFLDKSIKSFGNLIINIQAIVYLSINEYGLINLGISSSLFVTVLLNFYREIAIKEYSISQSDKNNSELFVSNFYSRILTCLFVFLVLQLINPHIIIKTIVLSSLLNASDLPELYWQSKGKVFKSIIIRNTIFILSAILKIYSLIILKSLSLFLFAFIIEAIVNTIISFILLHYDLKIKFLGIYRIFLNTSHIYKKSTPLLLTGLFTISYMRIDQFIIDKSLGEIYLGKYTFVLNFVEILQSFPYIFGMAIAPTLFQYKNNKKLIIDIQKIMSYLLLIGIILISIMIFIFPIISAFYKVNDVNIIMIILSIGTFPTFFSYIATKYLIHTNQISHFLKRSLVASIFSIIFNIIFINKFGLYATSTSYAISQWFIGFYSNKFLSDKNLYYAQTNALKSIFTVNFLLGTASIISRLFYLKK